MLDLYDLDQYSIPSFHSSEARSRLVIGSPLSFIQIEHFFAFGSPTALFIAMKEYETLVSKSHRSAESFLPSCVCKRIHNVQHPSDPIVSHVYALQGVMCVPLQGVMCAPCGV